MLLIREANLLDRLTHSAFREYGAGVAQKIATAGEDLLDFATHRVFEVEIDEGGAYPAEVDVVLNGDGRRALAIMNDVIDVDLDEVSVEPVLEVRREMLLRSQDALDALEREDEPEPLNAGEPDVVSFRYEIDSIRFEHAGPVFEFNIGGNFDASFSASVVSVDWRDEGLTELQGESTISGDFWFFVTGTLLDDRSPPRVGDVQVEVREENHWLE